MLAQFYSTLDELSLLINEAVATLPATAYLVNPRPLSIGKIEYLESSLLSHGGVVVFLLGKGELVKAGSIHKLRAENPGAVEFCIGHSSETELEESWLFFESEDADAIQFAKKISKLLKKITSAGVTAISAVDGAEAWYRAHRFTAGAKRLHDLGIKIVPVGGGEKVIIKL